MAKSMNLDEQEIKIYGPEEGIYHDGALDGRRSTDYVAGDVAEAGSLPYEVKNESGDWLAYLPSGERQSNRNGDSQACVTFSALNSIETQQKFLTGFADNYSDRWTAKRSETMPNGNFLWKVADTIRKEGLILETDYPAPSTYTWAEYHADIAEPLASQLVAKGKTWLENWGIGYEWINLLPETLIRHLKHAPIQAVFPAHAVMIYKFDPKADVLYYLDSYSPFLKARARSEFNSALKIVLTPKTKTMTNSILVKRGSEYGFFDPATTEEGLTSMMLNRGIKPPQDASGKLIWSEVDKMVKGSVQSL